MTDTTAAPWIAPTAHWPIAATITVPGSKSVTNRALALAALADGPSSIRQPLTARDTTLMAGALRSLGVAIDKISLAGGTHHTGTTHNGDPHHTNGWKVTPTRLRGDTDIDCGLAGTVMRFVPPIAALVDGTVRFDGDPHARLRPMGTVIEALRGLGTTIDDAGRGALPFAIHGEGAVPGGSVTIDASASSQFISGLLLAGAKYDDGLTVHHDGKPIPSLPHVEMTVAMLRERGVEVDDESANTWRVEPGRIEPVDVVVEPDLSNAAPFLAAALLTGGVVTIPGWPDSTTQPGDALRTLLSEMGARYELTDDALTLRGTGVVEGIDADLHDVGELTPVLAAVAAVASSPSHFRGIAHLRGHETDRLAALVAEINGLGGDAVETEDGLTIRPKPLGAGIFRSYADHRMAQAGAVLGLVVPGVEVDDIVTTSKTLTDFPSMWARMVAQDQTA